MKDTYRLHGFDQVRHPILKGHVKIRLHNCRNGKTEIIEGDNIVTNAVPDILLNNMAGAVDYSKVFGADGLWKKWFGGVLLFEQAFADDGEGNLDPDDYYPLADSSNHLFAHAGQTSIDSEHDDDLTRGNPVSAAFVLADNAVKQVFEWGPSRGNVPDGRYIRSLSLTHADTGDAGLGSNTYAFQNFNPLERISGDNLNLSTATIRSINPTLSLFGKYDESHGFYFAIGEDGDYYAQDNNNHILFQTNKVTVYIKRFPFVKAGLYETWGVSNSYGRKFTITSSNITFYANPCYYFDSANKRLWLFSNMTNTSQAYDNTHIKYIVIDCESETEIAHGTITSDTSDIACLGYCSDGQSISYRPMAYTMNIIKAGNYFFFPTSNGASYQALNIKGYKKINITNQADQASVSFNDVQNYYTQPVYGGGLIIAAGRPTSTFPSTGRVVNGNTGYTCAAGDIPTNGVVDAYADPYKPSSFRNSICGQTGNTILTRSIIANKMILATKFNLPSPIQKTSSQSMTVEYTLTEVSGNE